MSRLQISRSPDLKRLRDEGYDVSIRHGLLVVGSVPYVIDDGEVGRGLLISELSASGDITGKPSDHTVYFAGQYPCDDKRKRLHSIVIETATRKLGEHLVVNHRFSSKPKRGYYVDFYEKMTTYIAILS